MSLVNPGIVETRAKIPLPASMFSNDDLPTFERPMKANSGSDSSGHESRSGALRSKMADEMFTIKNQQPSVAANPCRRYNQFQGSGTAFKIPGAFRQTPRPMKRDSVPPNLTK